MVKSLVHHTGERRGRDSLKVREWGCQGADVDEAGEASIYAMRKAAVDGRACC